MGFEVTWRGKRPYEGQRIDELAAVLSRLDARETIRLAAVRTLGSISVLLLCLLAVGSRFIRYHGSEFYQIYEDAKLRVQFASSRRHGDVGEGCCSQLKQR